MNKLLIVLLLLFGFFYFLPERSVSYGPGVMVSEDPVQSAINNGSKFLFKDYQVTPLATIDLSAKVLSKEHYGFDRESELAPVDLALGWQEMSDEGVLENIEISQSNRWYRWRVERFPIDRRKIETNSANMHLIPANDHIESMIKEVRKGDLIELSGRLVRVDAQDGWRWISSLTRDDTGGGACELIFVEHFRIKSL